jgi:hypothetical protein
MPNSSMIQNAAIAAFLVSRSITPPRNGGKSSSVFSRPWNSRR